MYQQPVLTFVLSLPGGLQEGVPFDVAEHPLPAAGAKPFPCQTFQYALRCWLEHAQHCQALPCAGQCRLLQQLAVIAQAAIASAHPQGQQLTLVAERSLPECCALLR